MTLKQILEAKTVGDLIQGDVDAAYHALVKVCHPDVCKHVKAAEAFEKAGKARDLAKSGARPETLLIPVVTITTKKFSYSLGEEFQDKDLFSIFRAERNDGVKCFFKIPKDKSENDLVKSEREVLKDIFSEKGDAENLVKASFPKLIDFLQVDGKEVNIFEDEGLEPLSQILKEYNLDVKTAAWIWRRILGALYVLHLEGYVSGGVIPENILIDKEGHRGVIFDLTSCVKSGKKVPYFELSSQEFYPKQILDAKPSKIEYDNHMSAKIFEKCANGVDNGRLLALLKACKANSLSDSFEIHETFGMILEKMFGKLSYHPFPVKNK